MGQTLPDLRSNADENPNLSKELFKQPEIYFNSLGLRVADNTNGKII